ncbi:MAG: hypothetical protein WCE45_07850 [Sedimentisphaerales bacterium]
MAQELIGKKPALSGWAMFIFWWAMILFALHASTRMIGAGDTWVAMACGRHFINHGVNTVEPFSANSHKPGPTAEEVKTWPKWAQWITDKVGLDTVKFWHPTGWVDQNWLTHVFFYWLTHLSPVADAETFNKPIVEQNITYNSLVYWKYALYIVTVIVVYYTGRNLGVNPALSAVFACFALFVGRTFLDVRPAGFSNLFTAVLLFIFVLTINRNYLYIWLIVPLTALWCNLHGGYVYAFIVLVPFIGLHLLMLLPKKNAMCLYYTLGWLFFYAITVKFRSHEYLRGIKFDSAGLLYFILILAAGNIVLTYLKNVKAGLLYAYHIIGTFIIFIATSSMFYPQGIDLLLRQQLSRDYVNDSRDGFFVAFIGFLIIAVLLTTFRHRLKMTNWKGWWHMVAAAIVAFIAMILANPFRLTNLTHTFVVTVSEDAKLWKTVNEWHPAFEWNNPVGNEMPFFYMYVVAWVLLAAWVVCLLLKPRISVKQTKTKAKTVVAESPAQYEWPMIDLPLLVIACLTIYMAIGSRRFIPIAAIAACPVIAMFIDSCIKMMVASRRFIPIATIVAIVMSISIIKVTTAQIINLPISMRIAVIAACLIIAICIDGSIKLLISLNMRQTTGSAIIIPVPKILQYSFASAAFIAVTFLTIWWGYWYKVIYLDPWPDSSYLTSEFMRMTASYAKPFKACQFVRDNNLKGTVFNYWTEGGFIAYGQFPDPNTGKTPLQLYMDGRAQAAYNTATYRRWMFIMNGGEPARQVQNAGRAFTASDYQAIGKWLDETFQQENISTVFMPTSQLDTEFVKGLNSSPNWRTVYMDEEQRIFVDARSEQGRNLFMGLFTGQTKFPDEFSKLLTVGYNLQRIQDANKVGKGCEYTAQAFMQLPCQISAIELLRTADIHPEYRGQIVQVSTQYFNDFVEKKQAYKKQNNYRERAMTAAIIGNYLTNINSGNPDIVNKYKAYVEEFRKEQGQINDTSRW